MTDAPTNEWCGDVNEACVCSLPPNHDGPHCCQRPGTRRHEWQTWLLRELDDGEFRCRECGAISAEHPKDGMGECPDCAEKDPPLPMNLRKVE